MKRMMFLLPLFSLAQTMEVPIERNMQEFMNKLPAAAVWDLMSEEVGSDHEKQELLHAIEKKRHPIKTNFICDGCLIASGVALTGYSMYQHYFEMAAVGSAFCITGGFDYIRNQRQLQYLLEAEEKIGALKIKPE
jgi:hypothetical protein